MNKRLFMIGITALGFSVGYGAEFQVTVARQYRDANCTMGYLAVNGKTLCYTLEPPWKDNKKEISSIPAGKYSASLRYDHTDRWRIELNDVPNRKNVQIHVGNYPSNTLGCILVGKKANVDKCAISDSAGAYKEIHDTFYGTSDPIASPNKKISVEIKDEKVK